MARQLELLAPAGAFDIFQAVIRAGADAVYFGGSEFGARAYAANFSHEEILSAIDFAHVHGRRAMLAVNTVLKEREMKERFYDYLLPYYERGLDAVIVQDFGVLRFVREQFPDMRAHASTQMSVCGKEGARLLKRAGASRVVLSRELSSEEIRAVREGTDLELECFIHGALCYSYSGQCLFSSMLGGRSGNRGRCAQPCRLPYDVYGGAGEKRNGARQNYPLSPKDLCAVDLIPLLAKSGADSLKIEGRMKQADYAAGVVAIYRKYIDRYMQYGEREYAVSEQDKKNLLALGNRCGFTEGYFKQKNGKDMITLEKSAHESGGAAKREFPECREKISGRMTAERGMPSRLSVSFAGVSVTEEGEEPQEAKNRPLTEESLRERILKTGGTPFVFEALDIQAEDGLFLSVTAINELRRRSLERLLEEFLKGTRRAAPEKRRPAECVKTRVPAANGRGQMMFSASAETTEQARALLERESVSVIYMDSAAFERKKTAGGFNDIAALARAAGKRAYYILPAVFRKHTSDFYRSVLPELEADGFLAKSYDGLGFLLERGVAPERIRLDHNLYAWSNESRAAFLALGIEGDTVPLEINRKELRHRDNAGSEMIVYGRLPLMTSAQCLQKTFGSCGHAPEVCNLKDRYGVMFPVKNHCNECYNVIYNSRPLNLFPFIDEISGFGITRARLSFTIESESQVRKILGGIGEKLSADGEYTYGHFKRGVE